MSAPAAWLRRRAAAHLEAGSERALAGALGRVWARAADPVRPVLLPPAARVIGVGGATLGGSGKTPVALELTRALAELGMHVAVVTNGYPARKRGARRVGAGDAVERVGDEALMLVRELGPDVPVVAGFRRAQALELAASLAPVVIADALLQARPARLACSILVLDAEAPWGSARCPPAGDLRALPSRLLEACDVVALVGDACSDRSVHAFGKPTVFCKAELAGARTSDGRLVTLAELRSLPLGLAVALGRPGRVLRSLERAGVVPSAVRLYADHAALRSARGQASGVVAAWLTTPKCATKLGERWSRAPVWVLERRLELPAALLDFVRSRASLSRRDAW